MPLTKEEILARQLGREVVDIGAGQTVTVRGMTRAEAATLRDLDQDDVIALEARCIAMTLVEPVMTEAEVRQWLEVEGADVVQLVVDAVNRLSGRADGQAKGYTKSVPRGRQRNSL